MDKIQTTDIIKKILATKNRAIKIKKTTPKISTIYQIAITCVQVPKNSKGSLKTCLIARRSTQSLELLKHKFSHSGVMSTNLIAWVLQPITVHPRLSSIFFQSIFHKKNLLFLIVFYAMVVYEWLEPSISTFRSLKKDKNMVFTKSKNSMLLWNRDYNLSTRNDFYMWK